MISNILVFILFYLIGSFPSALVVGKLKNIDIREHGSGNLGSTNALRVMGKKFGALVFLLDTLKGFLPMFLIQILTEKQVVTLDYSIYYLGIALCIGHCYPIFAGFRGGKAVATSLGILTSISPMLGVTAVLVFTITTYLTKIVAIGSTVAFLYAVSLLYIFNYEFSVKLLGTVLFVLIIYKHLPNYKRIIAKEENKIGQKKIK